MMQKLEPKTASQKPTTDFWCLETIPIDIYRSLFIKKKTTNFFQSSFWTLFELSHIV